MKYNEFRCPACEQINHKSPLTELVKTKCKYCGHVFYYYRGSCLSKIYTLFVKIRIWYKTNIRRVRTTIGNKVISEKTVYRKHCWRCRTPIIAVKESNSLLNRKIGKIIYGNKKCEKKGCKYYICSNCGMCYCDYDYKKNKGNIEDMEWRVFSKFKGTKLE